MTTRHLLTALGIGSLFVGLAAGCFTTPDDDIDEGGPLVAVPAPPGDPYGDDPGVGGGQRDPGDPGDPGGSGASDPGSGAGDPGTPTDPTPTPATGPGEPCNCDSDCPAVEGHDGVCVYGVCFSRASAECSAGGSTAECPTGSQCWGMQNEVGSLCWPECSTYPCAGTCAADGVCEPSDSTNCHVSCGSYCSCNPGDCPSGEQCVSGKCVPESSGDGPGQGPGPTCSNLPARDCGGSSTYCGELVTFNPRTTAHYDDYPINGETANNQYRSYLRRDLEMLVAYATAKTLCKSAGWNTGIGGALGLGDMSEQDGSIPGTSVNSPGHPSGTHTNGYDIDVAYYQMNTVDNRLRPICPYSNYHCTGTPDKLDTWRTALYLGILFESNRTRVIGVDGQVGVLVQPAIAELCNTGWLTSAACNNIRLAYEVTDQGYGWFHFHHHHMHMSLCPGSAPCANLEQPQPMLCFDPAGCQGSPLRHHPHFFGPRY